jgi:uncharacterized membrane protein YfhO
MPQYTRANKYSKSFQGITYNEATDGYEEIGSNSKRLQAKAAAYNALIAQNPTFFTPNTSMTEAQFCALVGLVPPKSSSYKDLAKFNLEKVTQYTRLNKLLQPRGIFIKSKNYGDTYEVHSIVTDRDASVRYSNRSFANVAASQILENSAISATNKSGTRMPSVRRRLTVQERNIAAGRLRFN